jgi:hypothetical protein
MNCGCACESNLGHVGRRCCAANVANHRRTSGKISAFDTLHATARTHTHTHTAQSLALHRRGGCARIRRTDESCRDERNQSLCNNGAQDVLQNQCERVFERSLLSVAHSTTWMTDGEAAALIRFSVSNDFIPKCILRASPPMNSVLPWCVSK